MCAKRKIVIRLLSRIGVNIGLRFEISERINAVPDARMVCRHPSHKRVFPKRVKIIISFPSADDDVLFHKDWIEIISFTKTAEMDAFGRT